MSTYQDAAFTLASGSPRRRELLAVLQLPFAVAPADIDESSRAGESGEQLARRLAAAKALAGARSAPHRPVLGADTMVVLDGSLIGKPASPDEARAVLRALRGRPHLVLTAVALVAGGSLVWDAVVETRVEMRPYGDDEVEQYILSGSPFDKAGGYAIQARVFQPVRNVLGCYPNVVGLPLCEAVRGLRAAGLDTGRPPTEALVAPCDLCHRARALYEGGPPTAGA